MILLSTLGFGVPKTSNMGNIEREKEVRQVLATLLPAMEADGGGVELVSVEDGTVRVRFLGACLLCPSIGLTMKFGVLRALREHLGWVEEVIKVK